MPRLLTSDDACCDCGIEQFLLTLFDGLASGASFGLGIGSAVARPVPSWAVGPAAWRSHFFPPNRPRCRLRYASTADGVTDQSRPTLRAVRTPLRIWLRSVSALRPRSF